MAVHWAVGCAWHRTPAACGIAALPRKNGCLSAPGPLGHAARRKHRGEAQRLRHGRARAVDAQTGCPVPASCSCWPYTGPAGRPQTQYRLWNAEYPPCADRAPRPCAVRGFRPAPSFRSPARQKPRPASQSQRPTPAGPRSPFAACRGPGRHGGRRVKQQGIASARHRSPHLSQQPVEHAPHKAGQCPKRDDRPCDAENPRAYTGHPASALNSIAGLTTEFANPVMGTSVPAPALAASFWYQPGSVKMADRKSAQCSSACPPAFCRTKSGKIAAVPRRGCRWPRRPKTPTRSPAPRATAATRG